MTRRRRGVRRIQWATKVFPSVMDTADHVLSLPHIEERDRSQLLRRYIAEGLSRDLAGGV